MGHFMKQNEKKRMDHFMKQNGKTKDGDHIMKHKFGS